MGTVRGRVLAVSFIAAFLVTTLAFGYIAHDERQKRIKSEEAAIERAIIQMAESSTGIKKALEEIDSKTTADELLRLSAEIKQHCLVATAKMSDLPVDLEYTAGLYRFFNIASDYSESMSAGYDNDGLNVLKSYAKKTEKLLNMLLSSDNRPELTESLADELSYYPYIYYDGKYTNDDTQRGFDLLYKSDKISEREAYKKAKELLGKNSTLTLVRGNGFPPVYTYVCNNASVEISVMGGFPIRLLFDLPQTDAKYEENVCVRVAEEYIDQLGIGGVALSRIRWADGICFAEFARTYIDGRQQVLSDRERLTVGVSADTGRVCYYDAYNYYRYRSD
ncbi:MAG: hypothetical protein GX303_02865 [Clostridiales bacterium]|nr:hypothetical protein [Clostridiales bacterium]